MLSLFGELQLGILKHKVLQHVLGRKWPVVSYFRKVFGHSCFDANFGAQNGELRVGFELFQQEVFKFAQDEFLNL